MLSNILFLAKRSRDLPFVSVSDRPKGLGRYVLELDVISRASSGLTSPALGTVGMVIDTVVLLLFNVRQLVSAPNRTTGRFSPSAINGQEPLN